MAFPIIEDRRIGKFSIPMEFFNNYLDTVMLVMSRAAVVEASFDLAMQQIKYVAVSPLFESVPFGEKIPEYCFEITKSAEDPPVIKAVKIPPDRLYPSIMVDSRLEGVPNWLLEPHE